MARATHRPTRRRVALAGGPVAAALAICALSAAPASATLGPGSPPETGENITVFHNIDFVAVFNTGALGDSTRIDVIRNGVTIGTTTGPLVDTPEGPGLEANHGPAGAPQPGDCFTGHTPDIRPRDVVRVTNVTAANEVDEVTVDDLGFSGGPVLQPNGDITIDGFARRADGTPIPIPFLDSNGFLETSKFRGPAHEVIRTPGTTDGFTNVYHPPYTMERNQTHPTVEGARDALLGEGHDVGFGHVAPLPLEAMLHEGIADDPTTAIGCTSPAESNRVNTATPSVINSTTGNVVLNGSRMSDAGAVTVTLSDGGTGTLGPLDATETGTSWTLTVTQAQLATLADGPITVAGAYDQGGASLTGKNLVITKDTSISVPTASLASGTYTGPQSVTLSSTGAGETVGFNTNGGSVYSPVSGPINLEVGTHTIKFRTTDAAGNVSAVQQRSYTIEPAPNVVTADAPAAALAQAPPAVALGQASTRRLGSALLRLNQRISLRRARNHGISVGVSPAEGTQAIEVSIRRVGTKKPVLTRILKVRGTKLRTVRLRSSKFRRGAYVVEVKGGANGQAGPAVLSSVRITS